MAMGGYICGIIGTVLLILAIVLVTGLVIFLEAFSQS